MNKLLLGLVACAGLAGLAACSETPEGQDDAVPITGEVNLYSSRHYDTDLALYEDFTQQTGIKVNRIEADADALIERIQSEGEFSPADILITVDAGRLWRAEEAGVFAPVDSELLKERIPAYLRHPDGLWFGLSTRARIIIYNKADGKPEGLEDYADLADPRFKGDICVRSSSNIYNISLLSSIIAHKGAAEAEKWARGVVANFKRPPQGNDTSQIEAVAAGECRISVVNTYYLARYAGGDAKDKAIFDAVGVIFPDQDGTGTHINVSGAGLVKTAPNRDNALKFLEYLTSESAQRYFADGNNEYPAADGLKANSAVEQLGRFRADTLNAAEIGKGQAEAVRIFDRAGWN
ncbi:Fe(3+) ABC transporter substrate-binding protein [Erythrobacter dokdonensis]|uniref:Ferric iron ABC transporter, iron-binding protein n=1 Tax=Erythrobacter dokdonensis DSW-74 TaxID=1300349 RepID=A0A1A7BFC9_9SPHN|nr:Fe(3+) ABC transporter substrate-binding protein [Erythrobacter dokdonensis]OBV10451.1 Ferric iron ABC transporter, iron-binding protein [Erythrobacter dokdonensis DSW-74]